MKTGTFLNVCNDQNRLAIAIAAGIGLATTAGLAYWYSRYRYHYVPPKNWRKIGELTEIVCYPIKSCGPVRKTKMNCTKLGLQNDFLRDRVFMVIRTENGAFITGRQYPNMILIKPEIEGATMRLTAPGMIDCEVDIERLHEISPIKCSVWDQSVEAVDCGEEAARWFSRYILASDFGLRLVYFASDLTMRTVRECNRVLDTMINEDTGAFPDATSYMLLNESSLNDLNTRLQNPVTYQHFRPNFVVKGAEPYEEDSWKWVKIGDVIFRHVKPCTRCIFTTVDPDTAEFSADKNPLKELRSYRMFPNIGRSPVLGTHLGLRVAGPVSIGDPVYVGAD